MALALLSAAGFSAVSLLALFGREVKAGWRSYLVAVAAGLLLALAFGDLLPEGLELAGGVAVLGFAVGFALLSLVEAFTSAHTHHSPRDELQKHTAGPFLLGLAIHNFADGFVLSVGASLSAVSAGVIGLGVVLHQAPVGLSLAAVLASARMPRHRVARAAVLLGLVIPLSAALTLALPTPGERSLGALTGLAGGVLAYMGAAHLLPEVQREHPGRRSGVVFALTLILATTALLALGH